MCSRIHSACTRAWKRRSANIRISGSGSTGAGKPGRRERRQFTDAPIYYPTQFTTRSLRRAFRMYTECRPGIQGYPGGLREGGQMENIIAKLLQDFEQGK